MKLRMILERLLRPVVVKRRLPKQFGRVPIIASAQAGLSYLFRPVQHIDPPLLSLIDQLVQPNDVVWDVGANIGLFTIASAFKAASRGQIIAIEPDPFLVQLLQRSVSIQPQISAPIIVLPVGISGSFGFRTFAIAERARANNHLADYTGSTQTGGTRYHQTIITLTLDQLLEWYPMPKILKIDTEGAEYEILLGGQRLLSSGRPIILCEVSNRATVDLVDKLLKKIDYIFYDADRYSPDAAPLDFIAYNTLALPREVAKADA
jgi:FkbM family methyltransferase